MPLVDAITRCAYLRAAPDVAALMRKDAPFARTATRHVRSRAAAE